MLDAVVLAIALALDATAVATARSIAGLRRRDALVLAAVFGVFHMANATIGWAVGASAAKWIARWDHWVAFGLLAVLGAKLIIDAVRAPADEPVKPLSPRLVIALAAATSVDALAAGVSLPAIDAPVALTIGIIGVAVFAASIAGAFGGHLIGRRGGRFLRGVAGLTLIAIGVKTLVDHLSQV